MAAVGAGADAVGVVFAESPRQVGIDEAADILAQVPPFVARVGVFVDAPSEFVEAAVRGAGLSAVQFHGSETPAQCGKAPAPVIKTVRVGTEFDIEALEPFRGQASAVLLDKLDPQRHGGTGKTFSWRTIAELPEWAPTVLAGGLDPVNVGVAISMVHPFAVDVSSGVEERPGHKDAHRMAAFVAAVRAADGEGSR